VTDPETLLAAFASAIFLLRLVPQPIRLLRTGVSAGVSLLAALNATITDGAWIAYGVTAHLLAVWAVSAVALVLSVANVVLLRRATRTQDIAWALAWLALLLLAALAGRSETVLGAGVLVTCGPQVWTVLRQREVHGVSPWTWVIAMVDALAWGSYGLVVGDAALQGYGVVLLACATAILARLAVVQHSGASMAAIALRD
jgi:uncharacterized protein with PQ loop repeat